MSFQLALSELEEVYCTKLSKCNSDAFSFLCGNWDGSRIINFSYRLLSMSSEEKENDEFSSVSRSNIVEFLGDLMEKYFPVIHRTTTPPVFWIPSDEVFIYDYDQCCTWQPNDPFYHPELYLIYTWYTESRIGEDRSVELMREHRNKLNEFFIREGGFDHTLLSFACSKGMTPFINLLLENGASPRHTNNDKCLWFAILGDRAEYIPDPTLIKLLVENGAKVDSDACIQAKLVEIGPNLCIEIDQLIS